MESRGGKGLEGTSDRRKAETSATYESCGVYIHSLAYALPLTSLTFKIKIIHAGWLRDPETWPAGAAAPEPDDDMASPIFQPVTRVPTELSSGVTTPWQATTVIADDAISTSISRQASGLVGVNT